VANTYTLQLAMGTTTIDFINDSGGVYYLLDGTFSAPPPPSADVKSKTSLYGGERLLRRTYTNRIVTFSFQVKGTTVADNIDAVNAVYRLIERGSSGKTVGGGIYSIGTDYSGGKEVGEDGLLLRVALKTTVNEDRLTFKVVSGSLNVHDLYSVYGPEYEDGDNVLRQVDVSLECEPYVLGAERVLTAQGSTVYGPQGDSSLYDRTKKMFVKISASEVVGDSPGPIKFMETSNAANTTSYDGFILARESGNGLLSCPGAPVFSGASQDDMWVYGGKDTSSIKEYVVKIDSVGTPDTFKWSIDNGSTWVATGVSITSSAIQLGSYDVYVQFRATTGHTINDQWSFKNDQAYIAIDTLNSSPDLSGPNGAIVGVFTVNIPYGYTGRYRLVYGISDSAGANATEYQLKVSHNLPNVGGYTTPGTPWVIGESIAVLYAGVVDFTAMANSISMYPDANTSMQVILYARRLDPSDTSNLNVEYVLMVPVESQDSYFHYSISTSAVLNGDWNTIICGYDKFPVVGVRDDVSLGKNMFMPTSGEYMGVPPTLEPNIDQELYAIPIWHGGLTTALPEAAISDLTVLRYRPKYLVVG